MGNYDDWYKDDEFVQQVMLWAKEASKQIPPQKPKRREGYTAKVNRLAKAYPAVAEAKAHLDTLMALVENGE